MQVLEDFRTTCCEAPVGYYYTNPHMSEDLDYYCIVCDREVGTADMHMDELRYKIPSDMWDETLKIMEH